MLLQVLNILSALLISFRSQSIHSVDPTYLPYLKSMCISGGRETVAGDITDVWFVPVTLFATDAEDITVAEEISVASWITFADAKTSVVGQHLFSEPATKKPLSPRNTFPRSFPPVLPLAPIGSGPCL